MHNFGSSVIRCIWCEGKTRMVGYHPVETGAGNIEGLKVKCTTAHCGIEWVIYQQPLPNNGIKSRQKRLTNPTKKS